MQKSAVYRHATFMCVTSRDEKKRHPVADDVLSPLFGACVRRDDRGATQVLLYSFQTLRCVTMSAPSCALQSSGNRESSYVTLK